jgi:hypothetical protein
MRPDGLAREGWVLLTRTSGTRARGVPALPAGGTRTRAHQGPARRPHTPRARTADTLTTLVLALALAALTALPPPAVADAPTVPPSYDVVIPPVNPSQLSSESVCMPGTTGYLLTSLTRRTWVPYDGGAPWTLSGFLEGCNPIVLPGGAERLAYRTGTTTERLADPQTGTYQDFALPADYEPSAVIGTASGWSVLARSSHWVTPTHASGFDYHLLDAVGSALVERQVPGLPQGIEGSQTVTGETSAATPSGAGADGRFVIGQRSDGVLQLTVLDPDTGTLAPLPDPMPASGQLLFDHRAVGWYSGGVARLYSTADPSAAPQTVALPPELHADTTAFSVSLTDSALLADRRTAMWNDGSASPLYSVPLDGGPATQLLADAADMREDRQGGAFVSGGPGPDAWDTYLIAPDGGTPVDLFHNKVVPPERFGLSLSRGVLNFMEAPPTETGRPSPRYYAQNEGVGAVPQPVVSPPGAAYFGPLPAFSCDAQFTCSAALVNGSESDRVAYVTHDSAGDSVYTAGTYGMGGVHLDTSGGHIADASENFALYDSGSNGKQFVIAPRDKKIVLTRPLAPAALWGDTLWTATAVPGQLTQTDLRGSDQAGPVTMPSLTTDAPCAIKEIQADGEYLYWSCGAAGPAGVYDRTAKKSVAVPAGPALLGDGFVLRHSGDALEATDVRTGATRTVADLPADPALADAGRGTTWTVDKFRGQIAYTLPDATTHLVSSGFAATPLNLVLQSPGTTESFAARKAAWQGSWLLSGGVASSRLDLRKTSGGAVLRTVTGGADPALVSATWNGKDAAGRYVPDGSYNWTLTAVPADGSGPDLVRSGTLRVIDAGAAPRDFGLLGHDPDGVGDLFTPDTKGYLIAHYGTGAGGFGTVKGYGGWNTAATLFVPIGDIDDNGCNDMLVRLPSGEARVYRAGGWPGCAGFAANSTAYTRIGTGWQTYDAVTSPGDITGDGLPDVIARTRTTGELWLYASNGAGGFKARTLMYSKWGGYTKLIGAGDLNGDGIGDLLGWDSTGLWRYYGTSHGTFGARALVFSRWGVGYNAVVGVGDITGDGKADLVERDSAGVLWRNSGDGKGSFGARVKIGTGYGSYAGMV